MNAKALKILIVEDSIVSAAMMGAQIERKKPDFQVRVRKTIRGAFEELEGGFDADVIILDLHLPDAGPDDVCLAIPALKEASRGACLEGKPACVLAISADGTLAERATWCGADDFMEKCMGEDGDSILDRINRVSKCSD